MYADGTLLGYTEGDVTFSDGIQQRERKLSQFGESVIDLIITGHMPTISVRMAEPTVANAQVWMPEGTLVGTNELYFGSLPGAKAGDSATRLTLRPKKATGNNEDITLTKAVPQDRAEVGINSEGERIFEVTFLGLADPDNADQKLCGFMRVPTGS